MRWSALAPGLLLGCALALGCEAEPVSPRRVADARPPDARPPDARPPDARPSDARPPDARPLGDPPLEGGLDGDPGDADLADATLDAALPDPPGPPNWSTVGAATVRGTTWLAWASQRTVRVGRLDGASTLHYDPDAPLDRLPDPVVRVVVVNAGEVPFAVWSASDGPVRVAALDHPGGPRWTLDLRGPALAAPLAAGARTDLLVVGRDLEARLAWQIVRAQDGPGPITPDARLSLPLPDELAPVSGAVVLRFGELGRCLAISGDRQPGDSFFCRVGFGRIITDGERPLLLSQEPFGRRLRYAVGRLFGAGGDRTYPLPIVPEGLDAPFAAVDGQRALAAEDSAGDTLGQRRLVVAAADGLWTSVRSEVGWPWPDARLAIPRGPITWLLAFDGAGTPSVEPVEMTPTEFQRPYGIDFIPGCRPRPETCDGTDEDCDGRIDNGLCCPGPVNRRNLSLTPQDPQPLPDQILLTGARTRDRLYVALRYADGADHRWTGRLVGTGPRNAGSAITGLPRFGTEALEPAPWPMVADEGLAFAAARDYLLLIARGPDGRTFANWSHPEAAPLTGPPRPPIDLDAPELDPERRAQGFGPCADLDDDGLPDPPPPDAPPTWPVLAFELADDTEAGTSVLVVCPRRILRLYPTAARPDRVLPFTQRSPARLARLVRDDAGRLTLLYAFVDSVDQWALAHFAYDPLTDSFDRLGLPEGLTGSGASVATEGDLRQPFGLSDPFAHFDPWGRFARILTQPEQRFGWRAISGPGLERWALARRTFPDGRDLRVQPLLLGAAHAEDGQQRLWAVNLERTEILKLWLDAPTLALAPDARWAPVDTPGEGFPLLVVEPRPGAVGQLSLSLPQIICR